MSDEAREIRIEDPAEEKEEHVDVAEEASQDAPPGEVKKEDANEGGNPEGDETESSGSFEEEKAKQSEEDPASEEKNEATSEEDGDARYLRLLAEFQNYKKRTEKEKSDLYSYANEKIMTELLEVMDNFERALEQSDADGFKEGMGMIFNQLENVLTRAGLAEIDALGEEFDPNVHNAVMTEETTEYESGRVSGVMQKGYTLNGKVIRPSMVKVVN